jgi:hypothetical protein
MAATTRWRSGSGADSWRQPTPWHAAAAAAQSVRLALLHCPPRNLCLSAVILLRSECFVRLVVSMRHEFSSPVPILISRCLASPHVAQ